MVRGPLGRGGGVGVAHRLAVVVQPNKMLGTMLHTMPHALGLAVAAGWASGTPMLARLGLERACTEKAARAHVPHERSKGQEA